MKRPRNTKRQPRNGEKAAADAPSALRQPWAQRGRPLLLAAAILLMGVAAYWTSFQGVFVFDDNPEILEKPWARSFWSPEIWRNPRPLLYASVALNYSLGEYHIFGYHLYNLTVHLACALFFFDLTRRTLALEKFRALFAPPLPEVIAFGAALVWVVHPLTTEAVTYIVQRCESMASLGYLVALYGVLRSSLAGGRARYGWGAVAAFGFFFGLGSKQIAITAPLTAVLFDRAFLSTSWQDVLRRRGWVYALMIAPLPVYFVHFVIPSMVNDAVNASAGFKMQQLTWWEYLRTQPEVILYYLRLAALPNRLCFDYGWPVADNLWRIAGSTLALSAIFAAVVYAWTRTPGLGFLGTAFFLILAPTSSILPIKDLAVEHRMYLPLTCLTVFAALGVFYGLCRLLARRGAPAQRVALLYAAGMVVLALPLAVATSQRNLVYADQVTFWEDAAAKAPHNWRTHSNLSAYYLRVDEPKLALQSAQRAKQIAGPDNWKVDHSIGLALLRLGRYEESRQYLVKSLANLPNAEKEAAKLFGDYALVLKKEERPQEAIECYRIALELDPTNPHARSDLASLQLSQGQTDEAIAQLQRTIRQDPDHAQGHINLGLALATQGKHALAEKSFRRVLEINAESFEAHYNLGRLYAAEHPQVAVKHLEQALEANPTSSMAHNNLAVLLEATDPRRALEHYRLAVEHGPQNAQAHSNLGELLQRFGRIDEAVHHYQQALAISPQMQVAKTNLQRLRGRN